MSHSHSHGGRSVSSRSSRLHLHSVSSFESSHALHGGRHHSVQGSPGKISGFFTRVKHWLYYDTVRMVKIKNAKLGFLHILGQLLILSYIIGYGLIIKKSYQSNSDIASAAQVKVKGTAFYNGSLPWEPYNNVTNNNAQLLIYDSNDLVFPPTENSAVFITTNMWMTPNQTRSVCPWVSKLNLCSYGCLKGNVTLEGVQTGNCINVTNHHLNTTTGYCELSAWCPIEREPAAEDPRASRFRLQGLENFTVFVRMSVRYEKWDIERENTFAHVNTTTPGVNIWKISEVLQAAGYSYDDVRTTGIIVGLLAKWDCSFDLFDHTCMPTILFTRLDDPSSPLSKGYNYRQVVYTTHPVTGEIQRSITKRYGIRILIQMTGQGAKFDIVALLTAIGAGLGLLTIATIICDSFALYFSSEKQIYNDAKYEVLVVDSDEEHEHDRHHADDEDEDEDEHETASAHQRVAADANTDADADEGTGTGPFSVVRFGDARQYRHLPADADASPSPSPSQNHKVQKRASEPQPTRDYGSTAARDKQARRTAAAAGVAAAAASPTGATGHRVEQAESTYEDAALLQSEAPSAATVLPRQGEGREVEAAWSRRQPSFDWTRCRVDSSTDVQEAAEQKKRAERSRLIQERHQRASNNNSPTSLSTQQQSYPQSTQSSPQLSSRTTVASPQTSSGVSGHAAPALRHYSYLSSSPAASSRPLATPTTTTTTATPRTDLSLASSAPNPVPTFTLSAAHTHMQATTTTHTSNNAHTNTHVTSPSAFRRVSYLTPAAAVTSPQQPPSHTQTHSQPSASPSPSPPLITSPSPSSSPSPWIDSREIASAAAAAAGGAGTGTGAISTTISRPGTPTLHILHQDSSHSILTPTTPSRSPSPAPVLVVTTTPTIQAHHNNHSLASHQQPHLATTVTSSPSTSRQTSLSGLSTPIHSRSHSQLPTPEQSQTKQLLQNHTNSPTHRTSLSYSMKDRMARMKEDRENKDVY